MAEKKLYKKTCQHCKQNYETSYDRQKYCCDECRMRAYNKTQSEIFAEGRKTTDSPTMRKRKTSASITEIAVAARKAGMTYGQYVAKMGL